MRSPQSSATCRAAGVAPDVALKEAFGPDMMPSFLGMREYLSKSIYQYLRIPIASRPLSPAESAVERSYLLAAMGRPVEARAVVAEGAKAEPAHPGLFEVEGLLLDREQKTVEALAAFGKAVEPGSKRARVFYRVAQITRPPSGADGPTNEKIAVLLERALPLEPQFARAMSYLADIRSDLGQPEVAMDMAMKAVKIEPVLFTTPAVVSRLVRPAARDTPCFRFRALGCRGTAPRGSQRLSGFHGSFGTLGANRYCDPEVSPRVFHVP